jgi:hypothetical protein
VHVARPQGASLDIAELVEHEQRMVAGAAEMVTFGGCRWCTLPIHRPGRSSDRRTAELQQQAAVEIVPQSDPARFTR